MTSFDLVGAGIMARIDALAEISERPDGLARRCFTPEHRRANDLAGTWMREAGMAVREDAIGNIVGRYEGERDGLPAVMIGSHLDTVVMAGKYDGMLGVVTSIACVDALNREGKRLPFAVEVIGFADEEGVRFQSTYLGSRAVAGNFDSALLERKDRDGVSLADAMAAFGLDPARIGEAARKKGDILAYLEIHIEQGPVLENHDLPVGVVTAITGATRALVTIEGEAGHAGTVPMRLRRDALAAAAECITAVETVCLERAGVVGTVGEITASPGASNVIPGRVEFTIDLRAPGDADRIAAFQLLTAELKKIAERRDTRIAIDVRHEAASTPCDKGLMDVIARSIKECGHAVMQLPSGAGHDAAAMAELAPVGMIFVRCEGGISHSPEENIKSEDAETAAEVLLRVLNELPEVV